VKIQLRNLTLLRCRRHLTSGRQHPGTTAIAKGDPGSPESLAQGMFPKGFPMNPGELPISARKSGKSAAKGDRREKKWNLWQRSYGAWFLGCDKRPVGRIQYQVQCN
jgi:hypothetical protein